MPAYDTARVREMLAVVPGLPCENSLPVFAEPWHAQAFAMALMLHERGVFTWGEWAEVLGEEIRKAHAAGDPDDGSTYYNHWLATLERLVAAKGVTSPAQLHSYADAWGRAAERTPHGAPIELTQEDFSR